MRINLPNQITLARLALSIVFFICLAQFNARQEPLRLWLLDVSAALFIVAGLSDIVDGYLARKHNQVTSFGRVLDPFVDKILVIGAYVFLAGDRFLDAAGAKISDVAPWMVVVILGRELLVTSLRGEKESSGESFGATFYGKAKMALQSTTVGWILLTLAHPGAPAVFAALRPWLVYLTVIVTALSLLPYLKAARSVLSQTTVVSE